MRKKDKNIILTPTIQLFWYVLRSRIAEPWGNICFFSFYFWRSIKVSTESLSFCISISGVQSSDFSISTPKLLFVFLLKLAIIMCEKDYVIILVCIFVVNSVFVSGVVCYLSFFMSLKKYLFKLFAHFQCCFVLFSLFSFVCCCSWFFRGFQFT